MEIGGYRKYSCQYVCFFAAVTFVSGVGILKVHFWKCTEYGKKFLVL